MTEPRKVCTGCGGEPKPLSDFYRLSVAPDGHRMRCKACEAEARREYRRDHSAEIRVRSRERYRREHGEPDMATLVYCPVDAELRVKMFVEGSRFNRLDFHETLAGACWPDGAVFRYAAKVYGELTRWTVSGTRLIEQNGERVVVAKDAGSKKVIVKVLSAAEAAEGEL